MNAHLGIEQSRRDDLESIGYVLVYLANGSLPWQNLNVQVVQEKYQKIMEQKLALPIEQICTGLPAEFSNYMHYCRSLRFEDKPDYPYLRQVFLDLLHKEGYEYDYVFDWTIVDKIDKPVVNNTIERARPEAVQPSMMVEDASADNVATTNPGPSVRPGQAKQAQRPQASQQEAESEDSSNKRQSSKHASKREQQQQPH